ncbi:MAG: hypothetical protein J4G01_05625 [Dehalococcoidia bacterium]|nr:hypothetical protein [Dehalococcoidia bacterium]
MRWSRAFPILLAVGAISLLLSLSLASAQGGFGTVTISDGIANSDEASISIPKVADLPANEVYEGWFVSDDWSRSISTGILAVQDGGVSQTFTIASPEEDGSLTPLGINLFAFFDKFVVTIEPAEDTDPDPSDKIYLIGTLADNINEIRQINFSNPGSPAYSAGFHAGVPKGAAVGLVEQTGEVSAHAQMALSSMNAGQTSEALAHAEIAVNIITGGTSDLDGDGQGANPGDGYGAMTYASDVAAIAGAVGVLGEDLAASAMGVNDSLQGIVDTVNQAASAVAAGSDTAARSFIHSAANQSMDASSAADGVYMAAQGLGEYTLHIPPEEPSVGDPTVPQMAMASLIAGMVLLAFGGLVVFRNRRSRTTA